MFCKTILAEAQKNFLNSCNLFQCILGEKLNKSTWFHGYCYLEWDLKSTPIKEKYYNNNNNLGIWQNQEGEAQLNQQGADIYEVGVTLLAEMLAQW